MRLLHLVRQHIGANVKPAPALCVTDEARDRHRSLHHTRQFVTDIDVFPIARVAAANFFGLIQTREFVELCLDVRRANTNNPTFLNWTSGRVVKVGASVKF